MSLELKVQTDPGEEAKTISIDSAIKGSSSSADHNFEDIFKPYSLGKVKIMGAKAVVVNVKKFMDYACEAFGISEEMRECIESKYSDVLKDFTNDEGYWTAFWDNTSEVHHRDIMRFCFSEIKYAVAKYADEKIEGAETEEELDEAAKLEELSGKMDDSLTALYCTKLGRSEIDETSYRMLECSQGYQLSSCKPGEEIWKSQILSIQLDSGITKDQVRYSVAVEGEETEENIRQFLAAMQSVEIKANCIEIPKSHRIGAQMIAVNSVAVHRKKDGSYIPMSPVEKEIRVLYTDEAA